LPDPDTFVSVNPIDFGNSDLDYNGSVLFDFMTMKVFQATVAVAVIGLSFGIIISDSLAVSGAPITKESPGFTSADRNNAFRGIPFGTPLDEVQKKWELTPVTEGMSSDEILKLFIKNDEVKKIGDLTIQEVTYYFFQDKFYAVELETSDTRQTQTLRQALEIAYKRGPSSGISPDVLVWPGENVSTLLIANPATGEGRMLLFSNEMQSGYESCFLEAAKRTASQL
jgi:hypothetical protein